MNQNNRKAFSLIELSVVILIIGILVAGVTQSSRLISEFKLSSARTQTKSSPIASITGILLWVESTSDESFTDSQEEDGLAVSTWYDINPQSSYKNNATTNSEDPLYTRTCINGLPCLRFGGDKSLSFDGSGLVGVDYTIIFVEQRRSVNTNGKIIGSAGSAAANAVMSAGYYSSTTSGLDQYDDPGFYTVPAYSPTSPAVSVFVQNSTDQRRYFRNGTEIANSNGTSGAKGRLTALTSPRIGRCVYCTTYYNGDIGEIVIFNRPLKAEERRSIEAYLGKKWGIRVN